MRNNKSELLLAEINEFLEPADKTGSKEHIAERCLKSLEVAMDFIDEMKSTEYNLAYLEDRLSSDPLLDCDDYNFDIAFLAIKTTMQKAD